MRLHGSELIEAVQALARKAGEAVLEIYHARRDPEVSRKQDNSPLTLADLAAHRLLSEGLRTLTPDLPVLSEEGGLPEFAERAAWREYWLVDPLDGTREFLERNGEFTVNIALIRGGRPILGVVHVPVADKTYAGFLEADADAAWRLDERGKARLKTRKQDPNSVTLVASRRHGGEALVGLRRRLEEVFERVAVANLGSSLKICLLAEGAADLYPRLAPTCEWDTAAAHAILLAAGGRLVDTRFAPLRYNARADILNPHFLALADPHFDWREKLREVL